MQVIQEKYLLGSPEVLDAKIKKMDAFIAYTVVPASQNSSPNLIKLHTLKICTAFNMSTIPQKIVFLKDHSKQ